MLACSLSETKKKLLSQFLFASQDTVSQRVFAMPEYVLKKMMRTKKLTNVMTRMLQGEVEIESGRWRMILVNEPRHSQPGSGNGAEVVEACGGRLSLRRETLVGDEGCAEPEEQEETCVGRNFGETKSKSITWITNHEEKTKNRDMDQVTSTARLRRIRAPRQG